MEPLIIVSRNENHNKILEAFQAAGKKKMSLLVNRSEDQSCPVKKKNKQKN